VNPWLIGAPLAAAAGAGLAAWGAFAPSSQLYGPVLRRLPAGAGGEAQRAIALTFDDGPNPAITPRLLDLLDRYSARATFFVIGRFCAARPELVREIAARGHLLGNHTHTHPSLVFRSPARIAQELRRCEMAVAEALAVGLSGASFSRRSAPEAARTPALVMDWLRPPYGFRGPQLRGVARAMGFRGVANWSVMCYDWKPQRAERVIRRLARVRAGDIVLLHDGDARVLDGDRAHVVAALEHWLPRWRDAGLEFVALPPEPSAPAQTLSL